VAAKVSSTTRSCVMDVRLKHSFMTYRSQVSSFVTARRWRRVILFAADAPAR